MKIYVLAEKIPEGHVVAKQGKDAIPTNRQIIKAVKNVIKNIGAAVPEVLIN